MERDLTEMPLQSALARHTGGLPNVLFSDFQFGSLGELRLLLRCVTSG